MSSPAMIVLKSGDGKEYEVRRSVALKSGMIKYLMESNPDLSDITICNFNSNIFDKVILYCTKHDEAALNYQNQNLNDVAEELKRWDTSFLDVNDVTLIKLLLAAHYLNIEGLVDLTCNAFLDLINAMIKAEISDIPHNDDALEEA
ncbi:hypothetical protein K2173_023335 [Erythroxylum novogranatense]|uniref:SKP1-like protein n=1 Tax=Erythroxylum novogranatense TaxID=1862640 RepID=A0AAV8TVN3_9ROSI|nr:hypothetical protein K2173_023335 [Erythroxylum novogranatense]